jgi:hypothetical protein
MKILYYRQVAAQNYNQLALYLECAKKEESCEEAVDGFLDAALRRAHFPSQKQQAD